MSYKNNEGYPAMKDNEEQILKMLGGSLASDLEDI